MKTFHTYWNQLIPFYLKEPFLFSHIQSYIEQNFEIIHEYDREDMIQNAISLSNDHSEFDDNVFEDDSFCKKDDNQLYKPTKGVDDHYHHPRSQSGSEKFYYKPRSSKFQSPNKFPKLFDLPGTDTAYKTPTSLASQSDCSLHFNHTQTSIRNTRIISFSSG